MGRKWRGMEGEKKRKKINKWARQHLHAGPKGTRLCTNTQGSGKIFIWINLLTHRVQAADFSMNRKKGSFNGLKPKSHLTQWVLHLASSGR